MKTPHSSKSNFPKNTMRMLMAFSLSMTIHYAHGEDYKVPDLKVVEKMPVTESVQESLNNDFKVEGVSAMPEGRTIASSDYNPEMEQELDRDPSSQKKYKEKKQPDSLQPKTEPKEEGFFEKYTDKDVKNPNLWKHKVEYKNH